MKKVFLYRVKDTDDRDCCAYIDEKPNRFECGHYFGRPILHGSCYCNSDWEEYDNIETILTREEYMTLVRFDRAIAELGYRIEKGDERYKRGINMCADVQYVYEKLNSAEAEEFFLKIQESEKEFLMEEYELSEDDVEDIFNNYCGEYRDRSIVSCVFKDTYECGYEQAYSLGYVSRNTTVERYFDFEKFGEDLIEDDWFHKLDDGRVVYLNY